MKKFVLGMFIGVILSIPFGVYASISETIQVFLSKASFEINGNSVSLNEDYALLNYNGYIYVPIRFAAEQLSSSVMYDAENEKVLIKNNDFNLVDPNFSSIIVGNILVAKESEKTTRIGGMLKIYDPLSQELNTIEAKLMFFNVDGEQIGAADLSGDNFGRVPKPFETVTNSDVLGYDKVKLEILSVNGRLVEVSSEPAVGIEDIYGQDLSNVDKILISYPGKIPGKREWIFEPRDENFSKIIDIVKKITLQKAIDQSAVYGQKYHIIFYNGDETMLYSNNMQLGTNNQDLGKYIPNELTKELDSYIDQIIN